MTRNFSSDHLDHIDPCRTSRKSLCLLVSGLAGEFVAGGILEEASGRVLVSDGGCLGLGAMHRLMEWRRNAEYFVAGLR